MRSLGLRIRPGDVSIDPVVDCYLEAPYVDRVALHHWNLQGASATFVESLVGDLDRFADAMDGIPLVEECELVPVGRREAYVYMVADPGELAWQLFEAFTTTGLLTVPPVCYEDGEITLRVLGDQASLRAVIRDLPPDIDAEVERVGEFTAGESAPLDVLSDRQREALAIGRDVGYYDVPRTAGHEDVAERLSCSPSTATEHLQKAESKLVKAVLDGTNGSLEPP